MMIRIPATLLATLMLAALLACIPPAGRPAAQEATPIGTSYAERTLQYPTLPSGCHTPENLLRGSYETADETELTAFASRTVSTTYAGAIHLVSEGARTLTIHRNPPRAYVDIVVTPLKQASVGFTELYTAPDWWPCTPAATTLPAPQRPEGWEAPLPAHPAPQLGVYKWCDNNLLAAPYPPELHGICPIWPIWQVLNTRWREAVQAPRLLYLRPTAAMLNEHARLSNALHRVAANLAAQHLNAAAP